MMHAVSVSKTWTVGAEQDGTCLELIAWKAGVRGSEFEASIDLQNEIKWINKKNICIIYKH